MKYKPQKIEFNTPTELTNIQDKKQYYELLYTIKFDKETNKPIISLLHSTGTSDTALIPTLNSLIVPNRENMDIPNIIINSHSKEKQFKLILDTGSNVSLINKRLISNEMKNHVHKTKAKIKFPLLEVKEEFVEQINIQVNNEIYTFFIIELDIIDVLFGNDILKDSIINQKDKIIKLNNSTYKINYQQSNQLYCNVKAPRKHVTVSNDNQSQSHNLLDDDKDIKEQVTKFVESIPSQLCDILAKTNPEEEEIQAVHDFINDSFEDVIVDKLPDIPDQINNSIRGNIIHNIIHNIIIKKDHSTDDHKRHVEEMVLKFIDLGIIKRSESNYSSPIMLLKKRDSWRVDYQLIKVTIRDDHPFTPVDSLLNQFKDSKLFSKFDMIMGYFQVLNNPEHAKYTAFITHTGKFEYTRMPQGLVNTPSTFARLMVEIFGKIKRLLQYFDDLLVYSKLDYMVHFIEIIRMLLYCRKYLLFISREKSEMLKTEVDFLGFHIHKDGISPRAAKVRAISDTENEQSEDESSNNVDVPTDYQLSDTLLVLLPIKIKDTPKMFDETETERVRKLAKSIRKNNEAKQSLLKLNYHSKSNVKKSVNSSGNNTTGNSSNSKSSSGSNGRSNNFNGSPSNVASGSNNTKSANEEQEVNLPVGGRLFHHKQVWKELGLPNFCQEVVNGLKIHLLPNFKPMLNPIPISIPEGPKSDCITKKVQDLLLDDAIEQVLPNRYSKRVFYYNVFTFPKPGTNLHRPVLDLKRLNTNINNQSFKMEGIKNLPSMVKQGYYMVKLDIKKAYLHVLVDTQYRDLFRFVWKAPRIFTMLLRPVLRMLRDINVSVIAYLDDLLIVGSTKEECLSNLKKTMDLLVKLGFKLNLEKSVLEPTQSITFLGLQIDSGSMKILVPKEKKKSVIKEIRNFLKLDCCSPRKLAGLKGKLIALKDAVIPFRLYTRRTNKFHSQCLTLSNGDWDQSFPIPQEVKSEISHWLTVLNQWNGKEISLFPSYDYVLTTDASESGAGATLKKGNKVIKTWSFQWSTTQSNMSSNRRKMLALLMAYQALSYSRILQCKSRPPQPSFRDESQIIDQSNQELQLATEEGSV
ncbi:hypothetical protein ACTFIT_009736 [Dictyostelium discoideum]